MKIDGFRKGSEAAVKFIKKHYADAVKKEAIDALINKTFQDGLKALEINPKDVIGEPLVTKYEETENGVDVKIEASLRPEVIIDGYDDIDIELPEIKVDKEEIDAKIQNYAKAQAEPVKVEKAVAEKGDFAVIDFKGFIDGKEMENGSATDYPLELGSNTFIPGFEEQVEGMKVGETKKIKVTFPEDYNAKELAGKEAEFEVTLKEIRKLPEVEVTDELAKKLLAKEDATVEELENSIKEEIINEKKRTIYAPKKAELLDKLAEKFDFDLPKIIVEKEVDLLLNNKAAKMSEEEIKELTENKEKLESLRDELRKEAEKKVKLTFIIDEIAKKEGISVDLEQVKQVIIYEAIMQGQNPDELIKYYEDNGYLPVIQMSMVEDLVLNKLLDKKAS